MGTRLFRCYCALLGLAVAAFVLLPANDWLQVGWQVAVGWAAAAAMVVGVRRNRPAARVAWLCVAAGIWCNATGVGVEAVVVHLGYDDTSPTVADAFWLALYPGLVIGTALLVRRRTSGPDWTALLDTTTI